MDCSPPTKPSRAAPLEQRQERPRLTVRYHDRDGVERSVIRQICWKRGFGFYVRWNKYWLIVDPLATEISAD